MSALDFLCRLRHYKKNLNQRRRRLYRVAYAWCHDAVLADDLTQEALTKALKHLNQLHDLESLDAWLFGILSNCWRDHLRRRRPMEDIDTIDEIKELAFEDKTERNEIITRVRAAIARLPTGQREVLALIDLEGFSYPEVASMLEIPIGTVTSRISRARNTLKYLLKEYHDNRPKLIHLRRA